MFIISNIIDIMDTLWSISSYHKLNNYYFFKELMYFVIHIHIFLCMAPLYILDMQLL
jgi:hypothetical protein